MVSISFGWRGISSIFWRRYEIYIRAILNDSSYSWPHTRSNSLNRESLLTRLITLLDIYARSQTYRFSDYEAEELPTYEERITSVGTFINALPDVRAQT